VDVEIPHRKLVEIIRGFSLVKDIAIFDVYTGEQVATGKKSLAYRLTFQSAEHTLKDEEVNGVLKALLNKLSKETGATLRG
jgi:phenylalanyl-tRNA synthetase beta chain